MIKLVISGGDSFTYGAELTNYGPGQNPGELPQFIEDPFLEDPLFPLPQKPRWEYNAPPNVGSWAHLIANKLTAKHINTSLSGRSNSFIVRRIINKIYEALQHEYKTEEIFVQVMWTFVARQEIAIDSDTKRVDSPWFPIDPYVVEDESKSKWFKEVPKHTENWQSAHDAMHRRYKINKELGLVDYAKSYYSIVSDLYDTYSSLKEILMLQDFLESRSIKYMFTYVNEHVMLGLVGNDIFTNGLRSFIKFNEWYNFPGIKEFMGFDDWAKHNDYQYATSHPLEQAHVDAAELLYEKVRQILATKTGSLGTLPGD